MYWNRILWVIAVAWSLTFFFLQVGQRIQVYFDYKTTVSVTVKYVNNIDFPSVTICNQNSYRWVHLRLDKIKIEKISMALTSANRPNFPFHSSFL